MVTGHVRTSTVRIVAGSRADVARPLVTRSARCGFRTIAASKGVVIAAGWLGKIKTVVQFIMISTLLLLNYPFELFNWPVDQIFVALAVVLTVASGVEYIYKNLHIFDEAK